MQLINYLEISLATFYCTLFRLLAKVYFLIFQATIFVPLFEAGFVQRVIPTSNKDECDFSKAVICRSDECDSSGAWCKF